MLQNSVQSSLTYPDYSLIRTPVWEPIPMPQQKVTHLSGNSLIRTVSEALLYILVKSHDITQGCSI